MRYKYIYNSAGEKLRSKYHVAIPNMMETFGVKPDALSQAQTLYAGSKLYHLGGNLIYKDGMIDRYLFDGGYAKATMVSPTNYRFAFYYYNRDHLGNIREVVAEDGTLEQVTHYYPFGAPFCERTTAGVNTNATLQRYKYNGKELDLMHGLKWYDYGARMYDPILLTWNSIDPMCEKYYNVSPYAYCHNNPILLVDLNGTDDYFDEKGMFIERTDTGSNVFVMINGQYVNITEVDFSGNFSIIENIGRHYLAKSDYNDFNLTACSTGGDITIDAAFSNNTGTEKYNIYLTNGYVNKALGNCYDFECITYHEYTHRYFSFTHGGTIGEAYAIMLTAYACTAWSKASDDYIISQASYAKNSINLYSDNMIFSNFVVKILNHIFNGYASFELNNNKISKTNILNETTVWGTNRKKK